jgi:hypothetical protein
MKGTTLHSVYEVEIREFNRMRATVSVHGG